MAFAQAVDTLTRGSILGKQSDVGVVASSFFRTSSVGVLMSPMGAFHPTRPQGRVDPTKSNLVQQWSTGTFAGDLDFVDFMVFMDLLAGRVSPTVPSTGVYKRVWTLNQFDPQPYSLVTGILGNYTTADRVADILAASLQTKLDRTAQPTVNGALIGRRFRTPYYIVPGSAVNQTGTIALTGTPAGGTFILIAEDAETGRTYPTTALAITATGAQITTALEALPPIGTGNIVVTGAAGGPWTYTYAVALIAQTLPTLTKDASALTGGTTPDVSIPTPTWGAQSMAATTLLPTIPALATGLNVYLDTTAAAIGTTLFDDVATVDTDFGTIRAINWAIKAAESSWHKVVAIVPTRSITVAVEDTIAGMQFKRLAEQSGRAYLRQESLGQLIAGTSTQHRITIDTPVEPSDMPNQADKGGVWTATTKLAPVYDATATYAVQVTLYNGIASY